MSGNVRPREEWEVPEDDLARFQDRMLAWLTKLEASGKVPPTALAFEALTSALSALEQGVPHLEVRKGYSKAEWQQGTVEVPAALLRVLVDGWWAYRNAPSGRTLGECFKVEGGGQGLPPAREVIANLKDEFRRSRKTMVERLAEGVSWEEAAERVAEGERLSGGKVSRKTVERASEKHRKHTLAELRRRGVIE